TFQMEVNYRKEKKIGIISEIYLDKSVFLWNILIFFFFQIFQQKMSSKSSYEVSDFPFTDDDGFHTPSSSEQQEVEQQIATYYKIYRTTPNAESRLNFLCKIFNLLTLDLFKNKDYFYFVKNTS